MNYPAANSGELISLGLINPCPPQVGLSASGGLNLFAKT